MSHPKSRSRSPKKLLDWLSDELLRLIASLWRQLSASDRVYLTHLFGWIVWRPVLLPLPVKTSAPAVELTYVDWDDFDQPYIMIGGEG